MSQIDLMYLHSKHMGYGRYGMCVSEEFEKMGITVYDDLQNRGTTAPEMEHIVPHLSGRRSGRSNVILWITVPPHARGWYKDQVSCIATMWEGMSLPESFRDTLHNFDTVVVPSPQNLELFSDFHPNVHYVPLGIDPARWKPEVRQAPGSQFRFLIGGSGARKGTDLAVRAFKELFGKEGSWGDGPVPNLVLKNPKGEAFYGPRIQMMTGRLSDDDETALYSSAHCYLQPSRGEGFGLQPLQAIAQGLPTILTGAHGHESFAEYGIPIGSKPVESDYFIYGNAGEWWEPDFDELMFWMRDVYDNWENHAARAKENAYKVGSQFSWANTAHGLVDAIGRERLGPYEGSEEWFTSEGLLFRTVTRVDHQCEIAGRDLVFLAGKEYWEIADVKRILMEAGKLDPSCLDDGGLAAEQVARAGKYRAQYENCLACGKPL